MAQRRRIGTIRVRRTLTVNQTRRVRITPTTTTRSSIPSVSTSPARALPASTTKRRVTSRSYSPQEREFLGHVAEAVDRDVERPRDAFLCHAWADRDGAAAELVATLVDLEVDVWFSERDVKLGVSLARQLDAGLRASRLGLVLVTPAMLQSLRSRGFADQELGALLSTDRVIPIVHGVPYHALRAESPLLASRAGLSTDGSSLAEIAAKIAASVLTPVD